MLKVVVSILRETWGWWGLTASEHFGWWMGDGVGGWCC